MPGLDLLICLTSWEDLVFGTTENQHCIAVQAVASAANAE